MSKELEELSHRFILSDDVETKDLESLASRMLEFCQIDKNGFVIIRDPKLKLADRLMLILGARFLANRIQRKLDEEITIEDEITNKELATMLREKETVVGARLKELKDQRKVVAPRRGLYRIALHELDRFLQRLGDEHDVSQ